MTPVPSTLLVAVLALLAGAVGGRSTEAHHERHGLALLLVLLGPAIALLRWGDPVDGGVWVVVAGLGAILGRHRREVADGRPDTGPAARRDTARPSDERRRQAGRDLRWMLLFLVGLLLPVGLGLAAAAGGLTPPARLGVTLAALAACDLPLVRAGVTGRGALGVVQPWRWPAYLAWLGLRLALLVPIALLPWEG